MTDTDDLLDEATRLADVAPVGSAAEQILATPRVLRALVERVRQAEANLNERIIANQVIARREVEAIVERDAARGKLDKVREAVTAELDCLLHDDDDPVQCGWKRTVRDVLAILDGKE